MLVAALPYAEVRCTSLSTSSLHIKGSANKKKKRNEEKEPNDLHPSRDETPVNPLRQRVPNIHQYSSLRFT